MLTTIMFLLSTTSFASEECESLCDAIDAAEESCELRVCLQR